MSRRKGGLAIIVSVVLGLVVVAPAYAEREVALPSVVEMPRLIGMTVVKAQAKLTSLGHRGSLWEVENTKCETKPRVKEGQICYQFPNPGKRVGTTSPIKILVKGAWKKKPPKPPRKK